MFKNGDVLSGKILKADSERVYFKSPAFGSVSLSMRDIAEIRPEGSAVAASTSAEVAPPEPAVPAAPVAMAVVEAELPAPSELNPDIPDEIAEPKKSKWTGQAGMAIAKRNSNTVNRRGDNFVEKDDKFESYRVYGNVKWEYERNSLNWDWNYRYGKTDYRKTDDYYNLVQNYQYEFTPRYFASSKSIFQRDYRRGIENEYLQTAEMGVNWFDTPKLKLSTSAGGGYHKYDRKNDQYSDSNGKFVLDQKFRWDIISSLAVFQRYAHLGNLENYHFVFSSGVENKLIKNLFVQFEYRVERDTEVNYSDKSYYDKAMLTKLLYKF